MQYSRESKEKRLLAQLMANKGDNAINDAFAAAKKFSEAESKLERSKKSQMDLLNQAQAGHCCESCEGKWLSGAKKVLEGNGIAFKSFCEAMYIVLEKERGKYQNIYIYC